MIIQVINSPVKNKKYRAIMSDGSKIDFGLKGSSTYLDHKDETKRNNYRVRHLANNREHYLIKMLSHRQHYSLFIYFGDHMIIYTTIYNI